MALTDEQYNERLLYLSKRYPGESINQEIIEESDENLDRMFAEDEVRKKVNETLISRGTSTQAVVGPPPTKLPHIVETIASNAMFTVDLAPVWQAQRGPDGTLRGDGNGGNWHGGDGGGNETVQGSGPLASDMSYWYRISFMSPRSRRYLDKTVEALEEIINPAFETAAAAEGFPNWNGLDYTGDNDKNYLQLHVFQAAGNFSWGGGTGSVPIYHDMLKGGLPLQGAGGGIRFEETISEYPGEEKAWGYINGLWDYFPCPARSGLHITSIRNDASIGIGMQKTPKFRGSLLGRGVGLGPGTEQRQRIPGERTEPSALLNRGWLNILKEFEHPDFINWFGSIRATGGGGVGKLDYLPGANGDARIHFYDHRGYNGLANGNSMAWENDINGFGFCMDRGQSLKDAGYTTLYTKHGREDDGKVNHMGVHTSTGVQATRHDVIGKGRVAHIHDPCLPQGRNDLREGEDNNPCAWPGAAAVAGWMQWAGHWPQCNNPRVAYGEPWENIPLGAESTEWFEIDWLRGRDMQYAAETPAVRSRFINQLLAELGTRTGIFDPSRPGMDIMGGALGLDGGVAELHRTDRYRVWTMGEYQPSYVTGVGGQLKEYLNDPAYPTDGYYWKDDRR